MRKFLLCLLATLAPLLLAFEPHAWNNTTYQIPDAGDRNWSGLTSFLVDLATNAETTNKQIVGQRIATATPVTVSALTDYAIVINLTTPAAVTVNLPVAVTGQTFVIVDGKGDAATNNITVTPSSGTINGASTFVMNVNHGAAQVVYTLSGWAVSAEFTSASSGTGTVARNKIAPATANYVLINDGSGNMSQEANLAVSRGGTGLGTLTSNGVLIGAGTSAVAAAAGTANQVLVVPGAGGTPIFGAVPLSSPAAVTGTLPVSNGGTGNATLTSNGVVIGAGTSAAVTATGAANQVLVVPGAGGTPVFGAVQVGSSAAVTGTLAVANGGTGKTTTQAALNNISQLTTKGDLLIFDGTNSTRFPVGSDGTVLSALAAGSGGLSWISPLTNPMTTAGDLIVGGTSGATIRVAAGTGSQVFRMPDAGGSPAWGAVNVASGAAVTGILPLSHGGTGGSSFTTNAVVYGGASTLLNVAPNASGTNEFLTQSSSGVPAWAALVSGDIPTTLAGARTFSGVINANGGIAANGSGLVGDHGRSALGTGVATATGGTYAQTATIVTLGAGIYDIHAHISGNVVQVTSGGSICNFALALAGNLQDQSPVYGVASATIGVGIDISRFMTLGSSAALELAVVCNGSSGTVVGNIFADNATVGGQAVSTYIDWLRVQ